MIDPVSALAATGLVTSNVNSISGRGDGDESFMLLLDGLAGPNASGNGTTSAGSPDTSIVGVPGSSCSAVLDSKLGGELTDQESEGDLGNSELPDWWSEGQNLPDGNIVALMAVATSGLQPWRPEADGCETSGLARAMPPSAEGPGIVPHSTGGTLMLPPALTGKEMTFTQVDGGQLSALGQGPGFDAQASASPDAQPDSKQADIVPSSTAGPMQTREGGFELEAVSSFLTQVGETGIEGRSKSSTKAFPRTDDVSRSNGSTAKGEIDAPLPSSAELQTGRESEGVKFGQDGSGAMAADGMQVSSHLQSEDSMYSQEGHSSDERRSGNLEALSPSAIGEANIRTPTHEAMAQIAGQDSVEATGLSGSVVRQIARWAKPILQRGRPGLTIQLEPNELGRVRVHVSGSADNMNVRLMAELGDTKEIIQASLQQLKTALESQGARVNVVDITVESGARGFGSMLGDNPGRETSSGRPVHQLLSGGRADEEGREGRISGMQSSLVDYRI